MLSSFERATVGLGNCAGFGRSKRRNLAKDEASSRSPATRVFFWVKLTNTACWTKGFPSGARPTESRSCANAALLPRTSPSDSRGHQLIIFSFHCHRCRIFITIVAVAPCKEAPSARPEASCTYERGLPSIHISSIYPNCACKISISNLRTKNDKYKNLTKSSAARLIYKNSKVWRPLVPRGRRPGERQRLLNKKKVTQRQSSQKLRGKAQGTHNEGQGQSPREKTTVRTARRSAISK